MVEGSWWGSLGHSRACMGGLHGEGLAVGVGVVVLSTPAVLGGPSCLPRLSCRLLFCPRLTSLQQDVLAVVWPRPWPGGNLRDMLGRPCTIGYIIPSMAASSPRPTLPVCSLAPSISLES